MFNVWKNKNDTFFSSMTLSYEYKNRPANEETSIITCRFIKRPGQKLNACICSNKVF